MYSRMKYFVNFNKILKLKNCKFLQIKYLKFSKYCEFLLRKMLHPAFETIEADEVRAGEQDVQPYFEHHLWSEYCCTTLIEVFYMNVIEIKLVCGESNVTKLTLFKFEVTLPVEINHKRLILYLKTLQPQLLPLRYKNFSHAAKSESSIFY